MTPLGKSQCPGFLAEVSLMEVYVTNSARGMQKTGEIRAADGSFKLNLPVAAMITLLGKK